MGLGHSPRIITDGLVLALDAANPKNYNLTAVEVLVVAGGGGGGTGGGGGGAGGLIYNPNFAVTPGSALTVTVGNGGTNTSSWGAAGGFGGNSVFGSLTAIGGGPGLHRAGATNTGTGGSGGGDAGGSGYTLSNATAGQGFSGGNSPKNGNTFEEPGGGGGGAGGPGENASTPTSSDDVTVRATAAGAGGPGLGFNISGTFTYYGGGGGGSNRNGVGRPGGIGGGGTGGASPTAGTTNTGGGGGGTGYIGYGGGGTSAIGGSGIVIVRYPGPQKAIGGTITSNNGYTIHTFTTVGSTTFTPLVATNNSAILGLSDLSGRGNFGTTVNSPTYSSSGGGSIVFDGVDDRVECGTFSLSYLTISTWVYKTSSATNQGICRKQNGWAVSQYNGTLQVAPGTSWAFYDTGYTIPLNTWVNIVYTYSGTGTTGSQTVYVNGSNIYSSSAGSGAISANSNAVRVGFDDNNWFWGGRISNTQIYNRALSAAEVLQNYNALKGRYTLDGSTSDRAAPSASYLVSLGITADGIYWINLPTAGPTQIYCILNPAYDGGGWMMAMKATRGTTFNYSANYWTTANTLNPTQTNRNDGDAKFNSMNYFQAKDMMAVWPDISNGGSIPGSTLGWTWLENNFNDGTRITPISFFGITYPTMNAGGSGKFIKDAKTFSGWASGVFSSQADVRFYGFNYTNNPQYGTQAKMRWGFGWNENGEGLYPSSFVSAYGSNDVSGGIGMDTSFGSYSAGDVIVCCQDTAGINRSARVEVYVR